MNPSEVGGILPATKLFRIFAQIKNPEYATFPQHLLILQYISLYPARIIVAINIMMASYMKVLSF